MNSRSARAARGAATPSALAYVAIGLVAGLIAGGLVTLYVWPSEAAPAGAGAAAGPPADAPGFGPAPVEVVAAVETIAAELVQVIGAAAPARASLVASEVDGLVIELNVDEGSAVRPGQVLVRLRTTDTEQQLAGARASLEETEARLLRAETDFARLASLLERAAISRSEYDQAVAERDALARARERLQAEVARLQEMVERAAIVAPFGGRVTVVSTEVGEWVGQGNAILTLVDLSEVEVEVPIAERFISAIEPGFTVAVNFDALPGETFSGRVRTVVPQANPEARTFPVLVRVANPQRRIKSGMVARMVAQLGSPTPAILVAKDALVRRGDQVFVLRVAPGAAPGTPGAAGEGTEGVVEQVQVVVGPARAEWQVVKGDLREGDLIVVRGNERLFPGQPVRIDAVRELPIPEADPSLPIATDPRQQGH